MSWVSGISLSNVKSDVAKRLALYLDGFFLYGWSPISSVLTVWGGACWSDSFLIKTLKNLDLEL